MALGAIREAKNKLFMSSVAKNLTVETLRFAQGDRGKRRSHKSWT